MPWSLLLVILCASRPEFNLPVYLRNSKSHLQSDCLVFIWSKICLSLKMIILTRFILIFFFPFSCWKTKLAFWDWKPWVVKYLVRIVPVNCSLRLKFAVGKKAQNKPVSTKWASLKSKSGKRSLVVLKHFLGYCAKHLRAVFSSGWILLWSNKHLLRGILTSEEQPCVDWYLPGTQFNSFWPTDTSKSFLHKEYLKGSPSFLQYNIWSYCLVFKH